MDTSRLPPPAFVCESACAEFHEHWARLEQIAARALYAQAKICMQEDESLRSFCAAMGSISFERRYNYTNDGSSTRVYVADGEFYSHEDPEEIEEPTPAMVEMLNMVNTYQDAFGCTYGPMKFGRDFVEVTDW